MTSLQTVTAAMTEIAPQQTHVIADCSSSNDRDSPTTDTHIAGSSTVTEIAPQQTHTHSRQFYSDRDSPTTDTHIAGSSTMTEIAPQQTHT